MNRCKCPKCDSDIVISTVTQWFNLSCPNKCISLTLNANQIQEWDFWIERLKESNARIEELIREQLQEALEIAKNFGVDSLIELYTNALKELGS